MNRPSHKTEGVNHTKTMWFYPFVFTGEERNEETCYGYCNEYQPHTVKRMFDYKNGMLYDMRWDESGNLGQVSMGRPGEMFETGRFLFWTEDSRMHAAIDEKFYSYYTYDHSGGSCASREQSQACLSYAEMEQRRRSQRRLKLVGDNCSMDVNAEYMTAVSTLNEPTLYPSAYMVLTNRGYTNVAKAESRASLLALPRRSSVTVRKHYYAGTERVAARLGGGGLDAIGHAIGNNDTLLEKADLLYKQSLDQVNNRVLLENDLDCIMNSKFAKEEFGHWIDGIPYQMQAGVELNHDQFKDMVNSMLDDINHGQEKEVYFYHSNLCKSREQSQAGLSYAETQQSVRSKHLGSASWITDFRGIAVQHIQYLPYGEPYINQRLSSYNERFTFTGKERDEETGYNYHGARYYDASLMTGWLSVDPMSDKYPGISSYAYCAWNPIKLVDPDGEEFDPYMQKYASILRNYCNRQIAKLEEMETLTDKQREQLNGCRNTISEMDELEKDPSTLYCFGKHPNNKSNEEILGFTTYGGEKEGKVTINITLREDGFLENDNLNMKGLGALAHELKHAYQYYSGESAFAIGQDGVSKIMFNHKNLEIPAYDRGAIFCGLNAQQKMLLEPKVFESLDNPNYSNLSEFNSYYSGMKYQIIKHGIQ